MLLVNWSSCISLSWLIKRMLRIFWRGMKLCMCRLCGVICPEVVHRKWNETLGNDVVTIQDMCQATKSVVWYQRYSTVCGSGSKINWTTPWCLTFQRCTWTRELHDCMLELIVIPTLTDSKIRRIVHSTLPVEMFSGLWWDWQFFILQKSLNGLKLAPRKKSEFQTKLETIGF